MFPSHSKPNLAKLWNGFVAHVYCGGGRHSTTNNENKDDDGDFVAGDDNDDDGDFVASDDDKDNDDNNDDNVDDDVDDNNNDDDNDDDNDDEDGDKDGDKNNDENDWDEQVSKICDDSSKIPTSKIAQRSLDSRHCRHLETRVSLHVYPTRDPYFNSSTVAMSSFYKNNVGESSENNTQSTLLSNQPPQDASKTVVVCSLKVLGTGKLCNRIFSSTMPQRAKIALVNHQNGAVNHSERSKLFKCN